MGAGPGGSYAIGMGRLAPGPMRKHAAVVPRGRAGPGGTTRHALIGRGLIALYRNAPIGIARISPEGRFLRANDALLRMLGYTERELRARTFDEVTHPDDITECRRLFYGIQSGAIDRFEMEKRFVRGSGAVVWAHVAVAAVRRRGRLMHTIGFATDITRRKRAEEKLRKLTAELEERVGQRTAELARSNEALEVYANAVSHDLNAPLHKISLSAELLRERAAGKLDPQEIESLSRICRSAARMSKLIADVLVLSRVGRERLPLERVDLNAAAADAVSDLEPGFAESGGVIEIGRLPIVRAHSSYMRQLLQNLISNALKFRRPDQAPRIDLRSAAAPDGGVEISVRDNGIGFEQRYAEQIFEAFRRLNAASAYEGSGIGLTTCRRIARLYGGDIRAIGVPGAGATFLVHLPPGAIAPE